MFSVNHPRFTVKSSEFSANQGVRKLLSIFGMGIRPERCVKSLAELFPVWPKNEFFCETLASETRQSRG